MPLRILRSVSHACSEPETLPRCRSPSVAAQHRLGGDRHAAAIAFECLQFRSAARAWCKLRGLHRLAADRALDEPIHADVFNPSANRSSRELRLLRREHGPLFRHARRAPVVPDDCYVCLLRNGRAPVGHTSARGNQKGSGQMRMGLNHSPSAANKTNIPHFFTTALQT